MNRIQPNFLLPEEPRVRKQLGAASERTVSGDEQVWAPLYKRVGQFAWLWLSGVC